MRVMLLTSSKSKYPALVLKEMIKQHVEIVGVCYARGIKSPLRHRVYRNIKKTLKIGLLGTLNGVRMRKWYFDVAENQLPATENIKTICSTYNIDYIEISCTNRPSHSDIKSISALSPDLGISISNGYISTKIFSMPGKGMINVHHEILPDFPGAQSIIWPLYYGSSETGYSIHKVEKKIDGGALLLVEKRPITFKPSLKETVSFNYAESKKTSISGILKVIKGYDEYYLDKKLQVAKNKFTTPSIFQFVRMLKKHNRALKRYVQ